MSKKIDDVVDSITKAVESGNWTSADRLQKVLEQLVKLEVAAVKGKES